MQTEIPSSIRPSNSSPAKKHRHLRRRRRQNRRPHQANQQPNNQGGFQQVTTAGGIIFRRRSQIPEIFFIKDPFGKWAFPKGKADLGEQLSDAAIRESAEEAGLRGLHVIAPLGRTSFRFRRQGALIQKTVHFFLLEAPADAQEHFPTREELPAGKEPIFEGRWVPVDQVFSVSSYKNSDRLLARALRFIASRTRPQNI